DGRRSTSPVPARHLLHVFHTLRIDPMARLLSLLTLASAFLSLTGCGSTNAGMAGKIVPVKGIVTYRGKPVVKGTVRFEPDAGREAEGPIRADGTFVLTTFVSGDGAITGSHRVAVSAPRKTIPSRYSNYSLSRIEVVVTEG